MGLVAKLVALCVILFGCAPHAVALATPSTGAMAEPTSAAVVTAPARPRIVADTAVGLGDGRSVLVRTDGSILLGHDVVVAGSDIFAADLFDTVRIDDQAFVLVGLTVADHPSDAGYIDVARFDLASGTFVWSSRVNPQSFGEREPDEEWHAFGAGDRLVIVESRRVIAIDTRTGTQAWGFSAIDPTLADVYLGRLGISRAELRFGAARVVGGLLSVLAMPEISDDAITVELDLATGRRVHVDTPRPAPTARPLFETQPIRGDSRDHIQLELPVPPHDGFDGLVLGYTTLLWNTRTGKGVIFNPTPEAKDEILALARAQTIERNGERVPIRWTTVIDTHALASALAADPEARLPSRSRRFAGERVKLDYVFGQFQTGLVVDVDGIAEDLGAQPIRSHADLPLRARDIVIDRPPSEATTMRFTWGPIELTDQAMGSLIFVVPSA